MYWYYEKYFFQIKQIHKTAANVYSSVYQVCLA